MNDEVHPVERDEAATVEAVAEDEAETEGAVAQEEAERDDAGRGSAGSDDAEAWRLQAKIFGGVAVFMVLIATVYWFMSYEAAGTTFLAVAACMTGVPALYLGWPRNRGGAPTGSPRRARPRPPRRGLVPRGQHLAPRHRRVDGAVRQRPAAGPLALDPRRACCWRGRSPA